MESVPYLPGETILQWNARVDAMKAAKRQADKAANRKAAAARRSGEARAELRTIYADLPTCDCCGSTSIKTIRTTESSEDAVTRYVACLQCDERFRLILLAKNID